MPRSHIRRSRIENYHGGAATMGNDLEIFAATLPETQYNFEATNHNDKVQQKFVE